MLPHLYFPYPINSLHSPFDFRQSMSEMSFTILPQSPYHITLPPYIVGWLGHQLSPKIKFLGNWSTKVYQAI